MGRRGNVYQGRFGRGGSNRPRHDRADWLSPQAYNALSREEKLALAARRKQQHSASNRFKPSPRRRKPRNRLLGRLKYHAMVAAVAVGFIFAAGWFDGLVDGTPVMTATGAAQVGSDFGFCHTGGGYNCVVDGDTIWLEGQNIRIADIDAPETHEYGCAAEKALGDRATQRLRELVNSGTVTLQGVERDQDSYGRKLRLVLVDGKSVGDTLVSEGLARYYQSGKRPWC